MKKRAKASDGRRKRASKAVGSKPVSKSTARKSEKTRERSQSRKPQSAKAKPAAKAVPAAKPKRRSSATRKVWASVFGESSPQKTLESALAFVDAFDRERNRFYGIWLACSRAIRASEVIATPVRVRRGRRIVHPLGTRDWPDRPEIGLVHALGLYLALFRWSADGSVQSLPRRGRALGKFFGRPSSRRFFDIEWDARIGANDFGESAQQLMRWLYPWGKKAQVDLPYVHVCCGHLSAAYAPGLLDSRGLGRWGASATSVADWTMRLRSVPEREKGAALARLGQAIGNVARLVREAETKQRAHALLLRLDEVLRIERPWLTGPDRCAILGELMQIAQAQRPLRGDLARRMQAKIATALRDVEARRQLEPVVFLEGGRYTSGQGEEAAAEPCSRKPTARRSQRRGRSHRAS